MTAKKKKIQASGRYGSGYGTLVRNKLNKIESKQRKRQICPYCSKPGVQRVNAGIWHCKKCNKKFAGSAYFLQAQA